MAKFSFSFSFSSVGNWLRGHLHILLMLVLAGLFVAEALVIKTSVSAVLHPPEPEPVASRGVRVNFSAYDNAVGRVDDTTGYRSPQDEVVNPFRTQQVQTTPAGE